MTTHASAAFLAGDIHRSKCGRFVRTARISATPSCCVCVAVLAKEAANG